MNSSIHHKNRSYHVAKSGNDQQDGSPSSPLKTIMAAAMLAQPGDSIIVHEGTYRESIDPPRGGISDELRIRYEAAPGEKVVIKGSEVVKDWIHMDGSVWKRVVCNDVFGGFHPYANTLQGDWFFPQGREHHSGQIYINEKALDEAVHLESLFSKDAMGWYANYDQLETTLFANFGELDPNDNLVEMNVRQSVFYPSEPGVNYITVKGFTLTQAATPWAPPTTEQIGLIGVNWSKGWVIEDNTITHSRCSGITLGKFFDRRDGKLQYGFNAHHQAVQRVFERGDWTSDNIGHHVVRNNLIAHCEQSGIVGSHGGSFSIIEGNIIHDIHIRKLFGGFEQAGIKLHAPIDTIIRNNHIFNCNMGIWLDWMTQGSRISGNTMHSNQDWDIFLEIAHGPTLVDNNILLSKVSIHDSAQGGAYVHNLLGGEVRQREEGFRETPYFAPHDTAPLGKSKVFDGDERFYNNILLHDTGLKSYDSNQGEVRIDHNVYLGKAEVPKLDANPHRVIEADPSFKIHNENGRFRLELDLSVTLKNHGCRLVHTDMLGVTAISKQRFEEPDGAPIQIDEDAHGLRRDLSSPFPGPFELTQDMSGIVIWPLRHHNRVIQVHTSVVVDEEIEPR